jgi:radical SAM superfamily enzyme YgiQ (UPF0313 family)
LPRKLRILLVKPYQPVTPQHCQPPLGILYLISSLRARFGAAVEAHYWDLRLFCERPEAFAAKIAGQYDLVGISALNFEAEVSHRLAKALKALSPSTILALGGPYSHSAPERVRETGGFDWIFDGESERTFATAVGRLLAGEADLGGIPGLAWRPSEEAPYVDNGDEDSIADLDTLPMPAWDLVPFDLYASRSNMNGPLRAKRYAPLFTSRGCPYKCHYCHDIFGKRYRWRSAESVLEEIDLLVNRYGVREFEIVDDIYNLHKPRMREIAKGVIERYGRRSLFFCFPNGVRGDIFNLDDLPLLQDMGVYQMCVAIETVTPRLQKLIEKNLDVEHARQVIERAAALGITVRGFFMIGFPTETADEIQRTIQFALDSSLTFAAFFHVVPQQGTPIYDLARGENAQALSDISLKDYFSEKPWYQLAYGVDLPRVQRQALRRFYLTPSRAIRMLRNVPADFLLEGATYFFKLSMLPPGFRRRLDNVLHRTAMRKAEESRLEAAARADRWAFDRPLEAAAPAEALVR